MSQLWQEGPEWLKHNSDPHCSEPGANVMPEECVLELKDITKSFNLTTAESISTIEGLMTCQNYRTYSKLLRVTAQLLRVVRKFKARKDRSSDTATTVTPEELAEAESLWILSVQQQFNSVKNVQRQHRKLRLFRDNRGLWRCGGRLSNAEVPFSVKYPILLPRGHPLIALIVMDAHS